MKAIKAALFSILLYVPSDFQDKLQEAQTAHASALQDSREKKEREGRRRQKMGEKGGERGEV